MFTSACEVFRFRGKRFAVTFASVSVPGYVPSTYKDSKGNTKYRSPSMTRRSAVLCIIRAAYTGVPYTGIAVFSPKDRKRNEEDARRIALKRAIKAICATEEVAMNGCNCEYCRASKSLRDVATSSVEMWKEFRTEMLRKYRPAEWKAITDNLEAIRVKKEAEAKRARLAAKRGNIVSNPSMERVYSALPIASDNDKVATPTYSASVTIPADTLDLTAMK
jgi:hypothetical protein